MRVERDVRSLQQLAERARCRNKRVGLVPTMGALHEGHLELVKRAANAADWVVVSAFVNPTQFGPGEDLGRYPRDIEADAERLKPHGVDVFFAPTEADMYPGNNDQISTWVKVDSLDEHLCGAHRPGHFRGVTTIVAKLLNVVQPHVAVFGQKDAQQLVIIKRMIRDLLFDVEIKSVPIVREEDGLALSSRNTFLTEEQREQAVVLARAVQTAKSLIEKGELAVSSIVESMQNELRSAPQARVEYVEIVDQDTLHPVQELTQGQEVIAAVAAYFGETRLIDNAFATVGEHG